MNKTIFIALMAMLTVTAHAQKRRKRDNMPKTEICKDITEITEPGRLQVFYFSPKNLPIEFNRNNKLFLIVFKIGGDHELPMESDVTITFENGAVYSFKTEYIANTYNKKKERWFYKFSYSLYGQPELNELLRNFRITEFSLAEFKMVNTEPDKTKEYFNCLVDLDIFQF